MESIESEGKTVAEAVDNALKKLNLRRDQVEVQILQESSEGFMGFGSKAARVRITAEQAQAFAARAKELMKGSRPNCPVCSGPMDPTGHVCPRSNGHIVH